ncbi:MAG: M12 family metallopeptidase [Pseudobacter sp.]|uniref:M12 family metallopeptidase n=1 Tax=Pseudobacter sp. TaxID=2045420 RepID=UPI003F7CE124
MDKLIFLLVVCLFANSTAFARQEFVAKKVQIGQREQEYQLSKVGNYFVLNGDIIMGDDFPKKTSYLRTDPNGLLLNLWPRGYIPVKISDQVFEYGMFPTVLQALLTLNTRTNVRFIPYSNETDFIRIEMLLGPGTDEIGGLSAIGRQGGEQILFVNRNMPESVVLHELLHALGLWHEQSRADRNDYVEVNMSNVKPGFKHNFQIEPGVAIGPYDYNSIMHYDANAFGISKDAVTIRCKNGTNVSACKLGNEVLSEGDLKGLNDMFPNNLRYPRLDIEMMFKRQAPALASGQLKEGVYRIRVRSTGKYLDIKDISKEKGAVLQQWDGFNQANQKFAVRGGVNGFEITPMHSNIRLGVPAASTKDLTVIAQEEAGNINFNLFYILWHEAMKGYTIQVVGNYKYLGLLGLNNGGLIIQQEKAVQSFSFERVGDLPVLVKPRQEDKIKMVSPMGTYKEKVKKN